MQAKPTEGESASQYKKKIFCEACFPSYGLLMIKKMLKK